MVTFESPPSLTTSAVGATSGIALRSPTKPLEGPPDGPRRAKTATQAATTAMTAATEASDTIGQNHVPIGMPASVEGFPPSLRRSSCKRIDRLAACFTPGLLVSSSRSSLLKSAPEPPSAESCDVFYSRRVEVPSGLAAEGSPSTPWPLILP